MRGTHAGLRPSRSGALVLIETRDYAGYADCAPYSPGEATSRDVMASGIIYQQADCYHTH